MEKLKGTQNVRNTVTGEFAKETERNDPERVVETDRVKAYKTTYALRFVVSMSDVLNAIPDELKRSAHLLVCGDGHSVPVFDVVSDEPFELFGHQAMASHKMAPLCHVPLEVLKRG
jgi:hypothetical protein